MRPGAGQAGEPLGKPAAPGKQGVGTAQELASPSTIGRATGSFGPLGNPGRSRAVLGNLLFSLAALLAGLAVLGLLPRAWSGTLMAPLLLFGWAWPLLRRCAPNNAEPLKLGLFALALSPLIGCLVWLVLRAVFPGDELGLERALAGSCFVGAAWQWVNPARPLAGHGGGRSAAIALLLTALVTFGVGWIVLGGNAVRLSHHGLLHSAIALASDRALPPGNPWMAGAPLAYYWAYHVLGAFLARALWVAPTVALAYTNLWAAALCVLATWLCLAQLLGRARYEFWALLLSLGGLNLLGGYALLTGGAWPEAPREAGELLAQLRSFLVGGPEGQPRFDPRLASAFSKFGNLSSYPAALALGLVGLVAALQALGSGGRLWRHLAAACLGASLVLNPLVGAPWILLVATAALFDSGPLAARFKLPLALLLWSLPGVWLLRLAAQEFSGPTVTLTFGWERLVRTLWPVLLWLPLALLGAWAVLFGPEPERPRRGRAWLLLGLGFAPLVVAAVVTLPYENEYKFVRAAAWTLPWLAALGLRWLCQRAPWGLGLGLLAALGMGLLGLANSAFLARAYGGLANSHLPLEERPLALLPRADGDYAQTLTGQLSTAEIEALASDALARRAAYAFLRTDERVRSTDPILIIDSARPVGALWLAPGGPPARFIEPSNLQGHEAAAFAALDLYVDRPSQALDARAPDAQARLEFLSGLFDSSQPWGEVQSLRFQQSGRPLVFFLGELERRRDPKLVARLEQFGFGSIWSSGGARLYAYPQTFVAAFAAAPR